jgi:hypothetical protein
MIRVDDLIADLCELPSKVIGKKKRKEFQVRAYLMVAERTIHRQRMAMAM